MSKYKIGDWVITIEGPRSNFHNGGKIGSVFKIGNIYKGKDDDNSFVCEESRDIGNGVFFPNIRLALIHEIPQEYRKEIYYEIY